MADVKTLLSGVTTSTTGTAVEVLTGRRIAFTASASGGSIGNVALQGSFDGTHWFGVPSPANVAQSASYVETGVLVKYIRAVYDDQGQTGAASAYLLQSDEDD